MPDEKFHENMKLYISAHDFGIRAKFEMDQRERDTKKSPLWRSGFPEAAFPPASAWTIDKINRWADGCR